MIHWLAFINMIDWSTFFQAIGAMSSVAVVVSLIYLIKQTKLLGNSVEILHEQTNSALIASRAANHTTLREAMFKINDVFLQKPEIRKYFYEGVPLDKNNPYYDYAETTAELLLDLFEHMLWQPSSFPTLYGTSQDVQEFWGVLDRYIVDMVVSSPILLEYAQKRRAWYTHHITERMEQAQKILQDKRLVSIHDGQSKAS